MQYLQINKQSNNKSAILSVNNLDKIWHAIQQPRSLTPVEFHGLICRKIKQACFPTPETAPKTRTFVVSFFNRKIFLKQTVGNSRKSQVQYWLALIPVLPSVGRVTAFSLEQVWRIHFFLFRARWGFWVIQACSTHLIL